MRHATATAARFAPGAFDQVEDDVLDIGIGDDILVADDNPANLVAIEAALEPLGRRLVMVSSGVEALGRLLEQDFALILLDVQMPGLNGIETARMIRSRERTRGTPILFVTGMSWHDQEIDEAYEAGGFDFLVKPIRAEVLRAKARVFLKLQERTRALRRKVDELRESQAQLYEHELHQQRNRFESELLDTKVQQLAEGDRRQHELAGIIGNELLMPLQTLQTAFDLLRAHPNAGKGERVYSLVEHRLVHVTRLVKVLIDAAQVAGGQLQLHPELVDVGELMAQALADCRPAVEARRLSVWMDADPSSAPVMADRTRLLQALTALLDHAARSSPEGGEVAVASRVSGGDVVMRVTDSGRAVAPDLLPRMFDMFVGDAGNTASTQGAALNLGLMLVKRLVELHDGAIRVWSSGGRGTTFEIRLPLAPQDIDLRSTDTFAGTDADPRLDSPDYTRAPSRDAPCRDAALQSTESTQRMMSLRTTEHG